MKQIEIETEMLGGVPDVLKKRVLRINNHHYIRVKHVLAWLRFLKVLDNNNRLLK